MLVSVDADRGTVTLFGSTVITVPIAQIHKLAGMLRGKTVRYISEVRDVSGDEILDMVSELSASGEVNMAPPPEEVGDGRLWMRATGSGQLYLPLTKKLKLQFQHPGDFVSLDSVGYDIADRFAVVKALISKGKLEIVNTVKMNRIKRQVAQAMEDRDEQLMGDIIVDTGIKVKGRSGKEIAAKLAARRPGRDEEVIDMDDYKGQPTDLEGLSDDQIRVLQEGWGEKETDAEQEGEGETEAPE